MTLARRSSGLTSALAILVRHEAVFHHQRCVFVKALLSLTMLTMLDHRTSQ